MWYTKLLGVYSATQKMIGYRQLFRKIIEQLRPYMPPDGTYLDVGAGPGYLSFELAELFPQAQIYALDPSLEACKHIGAEAERENYSIVPIHSTIQELGGNQRYDVIFASGVFEHIGTEPETVEQVFRHLKEEGVGVVILLPGTWLSKVICWLFRANFVQPQKLQQSLKELGYTSECIGKYKAQSRELYIVKRDKRS